MRSNRLDGLNRQGTPDRLYGALMPARRAAALLRRGVATPRWLWLLSLTLLLAAVGAGCAARSGEVNEPVSEDGRITAEVRRVLVEADEIDADDLRIETRDGVVVLSGVQSSLDQVREMIERVSRIRGVREVVNRVRIVRGAATGSADP